MTASEIAFHFSARKIGRGKWVARCTAHPDRNASMSITEGKSAVLIRCWSMGCSVQDICKEAGLTIGQLWYAESGKLDHKARAAIKRKRDAEDRAAKAARGQIRYWTGETRKWESVAGLLFAHLVYGRDCAHHWHHALAMARNRHERLKEHWPQAPEVEVYRIRKLRKDITRQFVGKEIAEILGL